MSETKEVHPSCPYCGQETGNEELPDGGVVARKCCVLAPEPGSIEWWRGPLHQLRGPVDTILRLMEQEEISRRKALEALACLYSGQSHGPPRLPMDRVNWCEDGLPLMPGDSMSRDRLAGKATP